MHRPATPSGALPFLDTGKLALIYPRQSTTHQVENNIYSLENQLKLADKAVEDGFPPDRVVVIRDDLGVSARTIEKRMGMTHALALIDQGLVGALYAEDLTRLSRDVDTVDHMEIAKRCRRANVPVYYGGNWRDFSDRGTRLSYKIESVITSEMWADHVQKMHVSLRMKAERGQVAGTTVRWGYRPNRDVARSHPDRDKLVVYEPEAAIIRALVAQLPEAGSIRELYRRTYPVYWPDQRLLTYRTFSAILRHPAYRGHYVRSDIHVKDAHEAIIGSAEAAMIDALADQNRTTKRGDASAPGNVLCGLAWCPTCDRRLYNSQSNHKSDYRCQVKEIDKPSQFHFSVNAAALDNLVLADLWRRIDDDLIDAIIGKLEREQVAIRQVADIGDASRKTLERRIDTWSKALTDPDATDAVRKMLFGKLDQATRELEALNNRGPAMPHLDANLAFYRGLLDDAEFLATLPATWRDEPLDWRRSWMRRFIRRVVVTCKGRGRSEVAIEYLDGGVHEQELVTKAGVTEDELALVRTLWNHPDRPPGRQWGAWMEAELSKAGYPRTRVGVVRLVRLALGKKTK